MSLIPILGVPSNWRVPGAYAEILFAQGPSSAAAAQREVILVMPMLASGATWTANTVYRIKNAQDAETGAGAGSPMHRAARIFLKANKRAKLWALPYLPTSGGAPATATGTVTWATTPTGTGVTTVTVCGEQCSVAFDSSDTVTTIAANMVAVINARTHLPVTAANVAGVLTMTARIAGISQGDGTTGIIRFRAEISTGIATTVATSGAALGLGTGTPGADGSTTEASRLDTALATIAAARYYYIVTSTWSATALSNLQTHVSSKSEPIPGLRSVAVGAFTGALAAGQTLATARNYERLRLAWQPTSEHDTAELAGNYAAILQKYEELLCVYNFDGYRSGGDWFIQRAYSEADFPDLDDQNDAINDGLTPIASDGVGSYVVMTVSTRSKSSDGTVDDFRAAETHRVSCADEYTDTLLLRTKLNFANKRLKDDLLLPNGTVDHNQKLLPGVVTPTSFAPSVRKLMDEYELAGKTQDVAGMKASLRVVRDPQNGGRLEAGHDIHVIDLLHQVTFRIAEVSTG